MTDCWFWSGSYYASGYGQAWSRTLKRGTQAHRLVYEELVGPIPDGLQIDHLCRVRGCVNPAHLRVVTSRVNIMAPGARCVAKANAEKEVCLNGHPLSGANLYVVPRSGGRHCMECKRQRKREARRQSSLSLGGTER